MLNVLNVLIKLFEKFAVSFEQKRKLFETKAYVNVPEFHPHPHSTSYPNPLSVCFDGMDTFHEDLRQGLPPLPQVHTVLPRDCVYCRAYLRDLDEYPADPRCISNWDFVNFLAENPKEGWTLFEAFMK